MFTVDVFLDISMLYLLLPFCFVFFEALAMLMILATLSVVLLMMVTSVEHLSPAPPALAPALRGFLVAWLSFLVCAIRCCKSFRSSLGCGTPVTLCVRLTTCAVMPLSMVGGGCILLGVTAGGSACLANVSWQAYLISLFLAWQGAS